METRIELTETNLDVELALLTYDEMDAVAGGQSSASVDFNVSAAGVNYAKYQHVGHRWVENGKYSGNDHINIRLAWCN
jgi:hypothetical protein